MCQDDEAVGTQANQLHQRNTLWQLDVDEDDDVNHDINHDDHDELRYCTSRASFILCGGKQELSYTAPSVNSYP